MKELEEIIKTSETSGEMEKRISDLCSEVQKKTVDRNSQAIINYDFLCRCMDAFWYADITSLEQQKTFIINFKKQYYERVNRIFN